jgi:hypothetical protein
MPSEPTPSDLIAVLHRAEPESQAPLKRWSREPIAQMVDRLPEAVVVEANLGRFTPNGRAVFSGAGFCRMALRRSGGDTTELHYLGRLYLGLRSRRRDHLEWSNGVREEVMMAPAGLFEQPVGDPPRWSTRGEPGPTRQDPSSSGPDLAQRHAILARGNAPGMPAARWRHGARHIFPTRAVRCARD